MPADVTVFHIEDGEFELFDCYKMARKTKQRIVPTLTFKGGKKITVDLARGEQESNWFMQVSEDEIPAVAERLSDAQRSFLRSLHAALSSVDWVGYNGKKLNAQFAYELQDVFNRVLRQHSLSLRDGLRAVYDSFLDQRVHRSNRPVPDPIGSIVRSRSHQSGCEPEDSRDGLNCLPERSLRHLDGHPSKSMRRALLTNC